jgi:hypothetical protein
LKEEIFGDLLLQEVVDGFTGLIVVRVEVRRHPEDPQAGQAFGHGPEVVLGNLGKARAIATFVTSNVYSRRDVLLVEEGSEVLVDSVSAMPPERLPRNYF